MNRLMNARKPHVPPGSEDSMCSSQRLPSTPRNTIEKQVEPIRMKITMAVMRIVVW